MSRWMLFGLAIAFALAGVACGSEEDAPNRRVDDIPMSAVAVVGAVPIGKREFEREIAAVKRAQGSSTTSPAQTRQQALSNLTQQAALDQEAETLGVSVTDREVRARFAQATRRPSARKRLKRSIGTVRVKDMLAQLRVQLLMQRVSEAQARGGTGTAASASDFNERWRDRTVCRPAYAEGVCGPAGASED